MGLGSRSEGVGSRRGEGGNQEIEGWEPRGWGQKPG